jgi:hypothetical protein
MKKFPLILIIFLSLFILVRCEKDEDPDPIWTEPGITFKVSPTSNPIYGDTILVIWKVTGDFVEKVSVVLDGELISTELQDTVDLGPVTKIIEIEFRVWAGQKEPTYKSISVTPKDPVVIPPDPPTISVDADPPSLPIGGGVTILSWTTVNADTVMVNDLPYGSEGSLDVNLVKDSTFTFLAKGPGGQKSASINVAVETPPPPMTPLELLRNGKWYAHEHYITDIPNGIIRQSQGIPNCKRDDYYLFQENGVQEYGLIGLFCEGQTEPIFFNPDYTFDGDSIYGLGEHGRFVSLLNDTMMVYHYRGYAYVGGVFSHYLETERAFKHYPLPFD